MLFDQLDLSLEIFVQTRRNLNQSKTSKIRSPLASEALYWRANVELCAKQYWREIGVQDVEVQSTLHILHYERFGFWGWTGWTGRKRPEDVRIYSTNRWTKSHSIVSPSLQDFCIFFVQPDSKHHVEDGLDHLKCCNWRFRCPFMPIHSCQHAHGVCTAAWRWKYVKPKSNFAM